MTSEKRKEQYRHAWAKKQAKMQESGITRKIVTLKANEKVVIVKENDPDQTNLVENNHKWLEEELEKKTEELDEMVNRFCEENEKIEKIIFLIEQLREKNKGTVILAKQKDLATLVQQLEEILK